MADDVIIRVHYPAYFQPPWWFYFAGLRALDKALEARYGAAFRRLPPPTASAP